MANRRLSLIIALSVLILTALALAFWPRTYVANVTLMVSYEVNDPLNGKELPVGQVSNYISTQIELMQIQEVLLAVVDRLDLTKNKEYTQGYSGDGRTLSEWAALQLGKNLVIYQGQLGSQLIYVSFSANNANDAAQIANMVSEIYLNSSVNRSLQSQLAGQQTRMKKLMFSYGPRHPEVVELQSQIQSTRNGIEKHKTMIQVAGDDTSARLNDMPMQYKFSSNGQETNVSLISRAIPPVKATKPRISYGLILGALIAGILGFGIPLVIELFNRRVRCRDDIERLHGIPVLVEFYSLPGRNTKLFGDSAI